MEGAGVQGDSVREVLFCEARTAQTGSFGQKKQPCLLLEVGH